MYSFKSFADLYNIVGILFSLKLLADPGSVAAVAVLVGAFALRTFVDGLSEPERRCL